MSQFDDLERRRMQSMGSGQRAIEADKEAMRKIDAEIATLTEEIRIATEAGVALAPDILVKIKRLQEIKNGQK